MQAVAQTTQSESVAVPEFDYTRDEWTQPEIDSVLHWYQNVHGAGDTSLARFAPFMLQNNPLGFRTFRRHVRYLGGGAIGPICFVHTYAALGKGDQCLYQIITCRKAGLTKRQILEAIDFAWLTGGPTLNATAESAGSYLFSWEDQGEESGYQWPAGWNADPNLFGSGIDYRTDDLRSWEIDAINAWYQRMTGEVPRWIEVWSRMHPRQYKTTRIRYEKGFGVSLPAQLFPLFTLHLNTYLSRPRSVRQALTLASRLGVCRRDAMLVMEAAFVTGGEQLMNEVLTDEVIDVLESMPDADETLTPSTSSAGSPNGVVDAVTPTSAADRKEADLSVSASDISLEQAQRVVQAALQKAREIGSPSSVAVLGASRDLVAFARQDGALLASVEISIAKAYTSRSLNMATRDVGPLTQPGQPLYGLETTHQQPLVTFAGGRPLKIGDRVVGAIGVAGGSVDQDDEIAAAGVEALAAGK
jgi:uncharacterized protein GlcG (DUF336 family)